MSIIRKKILAFLLPFVICHSSFVIYSQELNCSVQVISPQFQNTADKKIFQTLQQSIYEFMNNRKWTNDVFQIDERIECSIVITVTDKPSSDDFKGSIQVQARRPIFKTSYNSLLFNYNDNNLQFKYVEYQPMEFVESSFTSNLTSVLAFYAYMIIGLDYDSFSLEGGTPYFQKAQTVVTNAQNAAEKGWKSYEDTRNRYWLVENMLNQTFKPIRECMYKYHRMGFDMMVDDLTASRSTILTSLELLKKVHEGKPGSFNLQVFFLAKADEIVNLFSQGEAIEKTKVVTLLNEIDPGNSNKYNKIL
ncbi:MAG: DUF4835 family protein [Bacteroidota bacterium]